MKIIDKRTKDSSDNYINKLFDTYAKLNVVRLDLSYKKELAQDISIKEVKKDLKRLLDNRRHNEAIFGENVGHICKLEKGEVKGPHLHTLFFFDGHKVEKDVYKASQIGKYWESSITDGKGLYRNCNANKKEKYKYLGIGSISHFDTDKRDILTNMVASYFAEEKQQVNDGSSASERTFFKGVVTKQKSNAGRPRKSLED